MFQKTIVSCKNFLKLYYPQNFASLLSWKICLASPAHYPFHSYIYYSLLKLLLNLELPKPGKLQAPKVVDVPRKRSIVNKEKAIIIKMKISTSYSKDMLKMTPVATSKQIWNYNWHSKLKSQIREELTNKKYPLLTCLVSRSFTQCNDFEYVMCSSE